MNLSIANRLRDLQALGQSIWLDEIHRGMLRGTQFSQLVNADGVSGVTSNPSIFAKAFAHDASYREAISSMLGAGGAPEHVYEHLASEDIRAAADQLRYVYDLSGKRDGYVSMEVAPRLAHDAPATVEEARRLWASIDRPNAMIKVPATDAGLSALRCLIAEGINVNATLIFGVQQYLHTTEAFMSGLADRLAREQPIDGIASVASFFVSRIDTHVDARLDSIAATHDALTQALRGRAAIAAARLAYQQYRMLLTSPRWQSLAQQHAQPQRLLWASTGTKDPRYSDVKYVDNLIGRDTVNTLPMATLEAYRDHGVAALTLEVDLAESAQTVRELHSLGIDLEQVGMQLQREGLNAFAASTNQLLATIAQAKVVVAS